VCGHTVGQPVLACIVLIVNLSMGCLCASCGAAGLKVMVECRSNSRHMLTWLMDQMEPEKDSIYLAVTKAQDEGTGRVRETSIRAASHSAHSMSSCQQAAVVVPGGMQPSLGPVTHACASMVAQLDTGYRRLQRPALAVAACTYVLWALRPVITRAGGLFSAAGEGDSHADADQFQCAGRHQ
jgi:hypothetical protein